MDLSLGFREQFFKLPIELVTSCTVTLHSQLFKSWKHYCYITGQSINASFELKNGWSSGQGFLKFIGKHYMPWGFSSQAALTEASSLSNLSLAHKKPTTFFPPSPRYTQTAWAHTSHTLLFLLSLTLQHEKEKKRRRRQQTQISHEDQVVISTVTKGMDRNLTICFHYYSPSHNPGHSDF